MSDTMIMVRYTLAWIPMLLIAIANGAFRDLAYGKYLGELRAHQVSTVTAVLLFGLYVRALSHLWRLESTVLALTIGALWVGLTVGFEFLAGHYLMGHPWKKLLHDYNILAGRIWVIVLLWIMVAPYVFYRWQK